MESLTFRLARLDDFDEIVKLSEGIYEGHDYLPMKFHEWLQRDNLHIVLAYSKKKLVGLSAYFVIDDGKTFVRRAARILPELRGQGLVRPLTEYIRKHARAHYPYAQRERFTTSFEHVSCIEQTKLLECDVSAYHVETRFFTRADIINENTPKIVPCSREFFCDVVLSSFVTKALFPKNVITVNSCPFVPVRSNIDYMLQEGDEMFVEKCDNGVFPRSFSFGSLSPRVKFVHWLAAVFTDDPALFEAHLLRQFRRAGQLIKSDFVFVSFQDKSLTPVGRRLLEEKLQLNVCEYYLNKTMKLYERDCTS
ncbi:unnamed protein product [Porites evermanni]|uniref:N-acetyltransferase domain-containing protein n=1 Tax=Porites evermanni TaxID=104178 RepID=A0ABN8SSY3_9CNID|nr:unnamed protein product [Porites evermanni]